MKRYTIDWVMQCEADDGEFVTYKEISAHMLKLKEVVEGMRFGLVTGHRQPCVCIDCVQHSGIDEALRLIGEVC